MNKRALRLMENKREFERMLSQVKSLKEELEAHLRKSFSFNRLQTTIQFRRPLGEDLFILARAGASVEGDVSIEIFQGDILLRSDLQFDLKTVRVVHDGMDSMIELAECLCAAVNNPEILKSVLRRFQAQ